jgi:hypothetical protein
MKVRRSWTQPQKLTSPLRTSGRVSKAKPFAIMKEKAEKGELTVNKLATEVSVAFVSAMPRGLLTT